MGDTQMMARWYEQVRREKRAKDKWQAKYLTEEQLELERQAEAAALSSWALAAKGTRRSERDAMLMRLAAVEREAGEAADEEAAGEEGGAATGGVPQARRMTAHQVARERIRQEVAATRERNHRITHDLTTESLLNDLGPALWISFNAGYKHPGATPGTRTGVSTIQKTHIYDPKADGAAKWSADIDKTHNLKMDTFMKHADKCLQLGEKPFKSGGMKIAAERLESVWAPPPARASVRKKSIIRLTTTACRREHHVTKAVREPRREMRRRLRQVPRELVGGDVPLLERRHLRLEVDERARVRDRLRRLPSVRHLVERVGLPVAAGRPRLARRRPARARARIAARR